MEQKKSVIYAFIDSQNLNLGVKSRGWRLDFGKFRIFLRDKYHVTQAYLFIGYLPTNQPLYTQLQKDGYIIVFKPVLEVRKNKRVKIKGNVDAELVLHTMIEYNHYRKAIIVSGDGDFHCLIEYLEEKGKLAKIIVPNRKYSSLLREFGRYIVNVGLFKKKVMKRNKK